MSFTEQVLGEVASLVESGVGSPILEPTRTLSFKGPQTSGVLQSYKMPFACFLVSARSNASAAMFSRGISWAAVAATSWVWHAVGVSQQEMWIGRMRFENGDYLYIDSAAGLGTSDFISFTFVEDIVHPEKLRH
jgi:hypothetical protein